MCTIDVVPAATLLVPYFEVDLDNPAGTNTLVSIHNALPEPVLAKVTLWTDYSIPSVWFDLFLTGYDVVRLNLGDTFHNGNIPITADLQSDAGDTISPSGDPAWDGSFDECENIFPFYVNPVLGAFHLERIRSGHTGQGISSLNGECIGSSLGDNIARGYITIDTVTHCSLIGPSEPGYFGGVETGRSRHQTRCGGISVSTIPDPRSLLRKVWCTSKRIRVSTLPRPPPVIPSTAVTPRPTTARTIASPWARSGVPRYLNGGPHSHRLPTSWFGATRPRRSRRPSIACENAPDWYPLNETAVSCWSEEEDQVDLCGLTEGLKGERSTLPVFPLETQADHGRCRGFCATLGIRLVLF